MPRVIFRNALDTASEQFTLWVDGVNGNDNNDIAAVRAGAAWQTLQRATWGSTNRAAPNTNEAAQPGDVVSVAAGTYSWVGTVNNRLNPVWNPANSGTASQPIRFVANGVVVLEARTARAPAIGAASKNYIEWYADISQGHKWDITANRMIANESPVGTVLVAPDTGPVTFSDVTGGLLEGVTLNGGPQLDEAAAENYPGIRVENGTSVTIRNNTIHNFYNATRSSNSVGMQLYGADLGLVEHNYIYDTVNGISVKDDPIAGQAVTSLTMRYNRIDDLEGTGFGFSISSTVQTEENIHIHQNLVTNVNDGFGVSGQGLQTGIWIYNNTFYNCARTGAAPNPLGSGGRYWNNIIHTVPNSGAGTGRMLYSDQWAGPAASALDFEHNVYYNAGVGFAEFADGHATQTIAQFRTNYPGQEAESPSSLQSDPMFVNLAGGDFRLDQDLSPCLTTGRDPGTGATVPCGAFITGTEVMGLES